MNSTKACLGLALVAASVASAAWGIRAADNVRTASAQISGATADTRTRQTAAETMNNAARATVTNLNQQVSSRVGAPANPVAMTDPPLGSAEWNTDEVYVDVPKRLLKELGVAALMPNTEFRPGVAELLGISASELTLFQNLNERFEAKVEQLERTHFGPTDQHLPSANRFPGKKVSFAIRPFAQEVEPLKLEWRKGLVLIFGETRAQFIFDAPVSGSPGRIINDSPMRLGAARGQRGAGFETQFSGGGGAGGGGGGSSWMNRGKEEERITFALESAAKQAAEGYSFTYQIGNGGSGNGSNTGIPPRWQKLITPQMLMPVPNAKGL